MAMTYKSRKGSITLDLERQISPRRRSLRFSPLTEQMFQATGEFLCKLGETKKDTRQDLQSSELCLGYGYCNIGVIAINAKCEILLDIKSKLSHLKSLDVISTD